MAERGQLGSRAPKGGFCDKSPRRKEAVKAKKNRLCQAELPFSNPPRRSQFRRVGHTELRALHCGRHGDLGKNPVKVSTARSRRRNAWLAKLCMRLAPKDWRFTWVKKRVVEESFVGFEHVVGCVAGRLEKSNPYGNIPPCSCPPKFKSVLSSEPRLIKGPRKKDSAVVRRMRRCFRKFRGGVFPLFCPYWPKAGPWRLRGPSTHVIGKMAEQLGKRPNRRSRRLSERLGKARSGKATKVFIRNEFSEVHTRTGPAFARKRHT
jgi:hypothetical protein